MNKTVLNRLVALNREHNELREITGRLYLSPDCHGVQVGFEFLGSVPGELQVIERKHATAQFPYEASKAYGGTKFFALCTAADLAEVESKEEQICGKP